MNTTAQIYAYWGAVILFLGVIHSLHRAYRKNGSFYWAAMTAVLTAPGTYLHELSHALTGLVLGARPYRVSITPKLQHTKDGKITGTFGTVEFANITTLNGAFVGLAPLMLVPLAFMAVGVAGWDTPVLKLLEAYLVANLLYDAKPSSMDMAIVKSCWQGPAVILGLLALLGWFLV